MASLCRRPGLFSAITVLLVSALIVTFGVVDIRLESGAYIGLELGESLLVVAVLLPSTIISVRRSPPFTVNSGCV